jgi:hypothetical protein
MLEIELAIVIETKANIPNARITTTTVPTLLRLEMEGQVDFQTQDTYFQPDTRGVGEMMSSRVDNWRLARGFAADAIRK